MNYGYKVELYDSSGKEISQEFAKEVTMTMSFDSAELAEDGISAGDLNMSFYSSEKNAWENSVATVDEASGKILAQMTHFSSWAPTTPASSGDASTLLDTVLTGLRLCPVTGICLLGSAFSITTLLSLDLKGSSQVSWLDLHLCHRC